MAADDERGAIAAQQRDDAKDAPPSSSCTPLDALWAIADEAERHVCYLPPAMDASWHPSYQRRLEEALDATLAPSYSSLPAAAPRPAIDSRTATATTAASSSSSAAADAAFEALRYAARVLPDGAVPWSPLLRRCVAAGLHADTDVGGGAPLLHVLLSRPHPPPIGDREDEEEGQEAAKGEGSQTSSCPVTLLQLLQTATPGLQGPNGATALHVVAACLADRVHFPPASARGGEGEEGGGNDDDNGSGGGDDNDGGDGSRWRDGREFMAQAAADVRRASYAAAAWELLLASGWRAAGAARNKRGNTAADLAELGLRGARADLEEIRDARGLPRAALQQFVEASGGGEARVREMLAAHSAGAGAVARAFERMSAAAEAQRRPAAARTAAVLLAVWALLVALAWRRLVVLSD